MRHAVGTLQPLAGMPGNWNQFCASTWWLSERVELLPHRRRVFIDIDSLLRPVYGRAKQPATARQDRIAVLRKDCAAAGHHGRTSRSR